MEKQLYWESQKGNLCRLHALNAYFGFKKISEIEFKKYEKANNHSNDSRYIAYSLYRLKLAIPS